MQSLRRSKKPKGRPRAVTPRAWLFALAVAEGMSPAQAARRAGYAFWQSYDLLRRPHVRAAVEAMRHTPESVRLRIRAAVA